MKWMKALARPWYIMFFLAVSITCLIAFVLLLHFLNGQKAAPPLDMQTGFGFQQAVAAIGGYTPEAKDLFDCFYIVDCVFLAAYGFLFASLMTLLRDKTFPMTPGLLFLNIIPLVGAGFDLLENAGIYSMIRGYLPLTEALASLTSLAGIFKMILFYMSLVLVLSGVVVFFVQLFREKKMRPAR